MKEVAIQIQFRTEKVDIGLSFPSGSQEFKNYFSERCLQQIDYQVFLTTSVIKSCSQV